MDIAGGFPKPTSFRLAQLAQDAYDLPLKLFVEQGDGLENHPSLPHLCLLVFEAVLEVVCVSLPGYIIARLGHFDADKQKFLANLNVMLFTPCLIFTKLASQLNAEKLSELAIIPAIFVVQTAVSWIVSVLIVKAFRFNKRAANFVTAMGVFGNSNSLPISLVMSLSQTIKGLHWDRIPGDNDDEVAARGILYLLIFQQLGQLVRWSWGYHVLLAPKNKYEEYQVEIAEEGQQGQYHDEPQDDEIRALPDSLEGDTEEEDENRSVDSRDYVPAGRTPISGASQSSMAASSDDEDLLSPKKSRATYSTFSKRVRSSSLDGITSETRFPHVRDSQVERRSWGARAGAHVYGYLLKIHNALPRPVQIVMSLIKRVVAKTFTFIWEFMNPPLWAMLAAVLVASVSSLQKLFFEDGSFINNSVTSAVKSSGGVAVPLILVVLGANLARNTMACEDSHDPEEEEIGTKLLVASLLSRMVLPTAIMAPILACTAKYLNVSILDDPIFIIVCFLLTGAPSALQLAQICQINMVYEKTMGRILFQSYVICVYETSNLSRSTSGMIGQYQCLGVRDGTNDQITAARRAVDSFLLIA
ncbi:hypothetical protein E4U36_003913 [Claviceps purpurea]|nr:hypothetical protein E4U11_000230 [Claviceps purpurea]KAG6181707.1 hypothetical protein E4U36_003913 [Claviceps purpurea]KAG6264952.1 hypothetical protein E4U49_001301 [Claviceps purpurea]KAG6311381.1 hypothetical protein E4U44_004385 [Claviceps purpurea]